MTEKSPRATNQENFGDNYGTPNWSLIQSRIEESRQLDHADKEWLKSVAEKLQKENLPPDEQSVAPAKMDALTTEFGKEKPDKNVIQRAWKFLEAAVPTLEKLANTSSKIASFLN